MKPSADYIRLVEVVLSGGMCFGGGEVDVCMYLCVLVIQLFAFHQHSISF